MFPKVIFVFFLVAGAALYWRRRRTLPLALFLFIASVFLSRVYWRMAGTTIRFEQIAALLLSGWFFVDLLRRKIEFRLPWQAILVLALFPLMLISSLLASPAPVQSLKKSLLYFPYFLAFLALVHYLSSPDKFQEAWRAFYVFGAAAVSVSVIGFYLLFFGVNVGMVRIEFGSLWLRGTMVVPNIMGSTAAIVFLVALVRLTGGNYGVRKERVVDMAVLAVSLAAAMMSYTRTAWIAILGGMVFVVYLRRKTLPLKSAAAVLLLMAGSGVFVSFSTAESKWLRITEKRGASMGEFGEVKKDELLHPKEEREARSIDYAKKIKAMIGNEQKDKWRYKVVKRALADWRLSPIVGRGTDSLQVMEKDDRSKIVYYIPVTLVSILHDWGLIGLLVYCSFLLAVFLRLTKVLASESEGRWRDLALEILSVFVVSTFMYQISTTMQLSVFWCLAAFYAAAISLKPWPASETSPDKTRIAGESSSAVG